MSVVYVFAASKMEGESVDQIAPPPTLTSSPHNETHRSSGSNHLILVIGGMGPRGASAKAEAALGLGSMSKTSTPSTKSKPDVILVIGLCGGLSASLSEGRIVAYTDCLSTDRAKPPLSCSPSITDAVTQLLSSSSMPCDRVVGVTSPRIATNRDQRLSLAKSGATVVDMESYAILEAASRAGVPAAVLRVVSDSVDRELPDLNRALNDDGALDGRKALGVAIRSPLKTLRLLSANKRAMRHLGKALEIILPADCFGGGPSRAQ
jgi:nucleoside phosphorylase